MRAGSAVRLVFLALSFCGCFSQTLIQSKASITRTAGKMVRFRCAINSDDFANLLVHWYRDSRSGGFRRILYIKANSAANKDPGSSDRLTAENLVTEKASLLDIRDIEESDAGVYYCAIWERPTGAWKKIFGSGTRLIVTGTEVKAPTLRLFPPQIVDAEGFLVCLVTGFFPEVIKVQWKIAGDEKADTSTNTFTDSVKEMHGKTYSLISRFKISKLDWEAKTFTCHVQHEGGSREASISRQSRLAASKTDVVTGPPCPPSVQESLEITDEGTSSSSLKVATLTYTLLLMKSVLYCGIISFILYKVEYRGTQKPL